MNLPNFPGWHLIGAFESDVGSWLLHHGGEAMLLEVPEGLTVETVEAALDRLGIRMPKYVAVSHEHEDHLDANLWADLLLAFPKAKFFRAKDIPDRLPLYLGGEPLWLLKAPKHSWTDVVTVFRGVAMTGDIELGTLDSVNDEVSLRVKRRSMNLLEDFVDHHGYHIHSLVSAHLDDVRTGIDWPALFTC